MSQTKIAFIIIFAMTSMLIAIIIGLNTIDYLLYADPISLTAKWTLIGSFIGAVISFSLFVTLDKYKDHKSTKKKDTLILHSICHELTACLSNCIECSAHLEKEKALMMSRTDSQSLIMPPPILHLNIWELLKYHVPIYLKENPDMLVELRRASHRVAYFNLQLSSREDFHIKCRTQTNYRTDLLIFDNTLIKTLNDQMIPMIKPLTEEFHSFCIST